MGKYDPGRTNSERIQLRRQANEDAANLRIRKNVRAASRAPMRGTGCGDEDIWNPPPNRLDAESVEDERRGRMFCAKCGDEVKHVQLGESVSVRSLDGIPHLLTCEGED
jgi:hypothetical protein